MVVMMVSAIVGFFLGVLAVLAVEVGLLVFLIRWLSKKSSQAAKSGAVSSAQHPLDSSQSLFSIYQKQVGLIFPPTPIYVVFYAVFDCGLNA